MHQIVLLTAIAATSGLFGGGRSTCVNGQCSRYVTAVPATYQVAPAAPVYQMAPMVYQSPAYAYPMTYSQPVVYQTAPVYQAPVMTYQPTYSYYAPAVTCTTGNCPAR